MDMMLECFMSWQAAVAAACMEQGFWCDAIDPRTGLCMRGRTGHPWNEVKAAHALLGYPVNDQGTCPLLQHPDFGAICVLCSNACLRRSRSCVPLVLS